MDDTPNTTTEITESYSIHDEHRARKAWVLTGCAVAFWLLVGVIHCYVVYNKGYGQLNGSLGQTVTAFSHALNSRFVWLNDQAHLIAQDDIWKENFPFALQVVDSKDKKISDEKQKCLSDLLNNSDGTVLVVLNEKKQVVRAVERSYPSTFIDAVVPGEQSNSEEQSELERQVSVLPEIGTVLEAPPVLSAFEFAESQSGYVRFRKDGAVFSAVVVPLLEEKKVKGALLLGEILSDKLLGECSQGMLDGILTVVVDHKILAAFDKRIARRPAPLLLTSLEDTVEAWKPANTAQKITLKEGEPDAAPDMVEVAGRKWSALSMELSGAGKHPAGWVLFLADTSEVDDTVRYDICIFAVAIGIFLPFCYFLSWKVQES